MSKMSKSFYSCLGKKIWIFIEQSVTPGLDHSQRNSEALTWLDCATTLGKGFVYSRTSPALPKYCTPPRAPGHRLLEISFRLPGDEQGTRSTLHELIQTFAYQPGIVIGSTDPSLLALGWVYSLFYSLFFWERKDRSLGKQMWVFPVRVIKPDGKPLLIIESFP